MLNYIKGRFILPEIKSAANNITDEIGTKAHNIISDAGNAIKGKLGYLPKSRWKLKTDKTFLKLEEDSTLSEKIIVFQEILKTKSEIARFIFDDRNKKSIEEFQKTSKGEIQNENTAYNDLVESEIMINNDVNNHKMLSYMKKLLNEISSTDQSKALLPQTYYKYYQISLRLLGTSAKDIEFSEIESKNFEENIDSDLHESGLIHRLEEGIQRLNEANQGYSQIANQYMLTNPRIQETMTDVKHYISRDLEKSESYDESSRNIRNIAPVEGILGLSSSEFLRQKEDIKSVLINEFEDKHEGNSFSEDFFDDEELGTLKLLENELIQKKIEDINSQQAILLKKFTDLENKREELDLKIKSNNNIRRTLRSFHLNPETRPITPPRKKLPSLRRPLESRTQEKEIVRSKGYSSLPPINKYSGQMASNNSDLNSPYHNKKKIPTKPTTLPPIERGTY